MQKTILYDKIIFYFSLILLILWVLRAAFLQQLYTENTLSLWANKLFIPMIILLFLLPCLIVFRTYKNRIAIASYLFAALMLNVLTLLTVFLSNN
ncbi:hypothetical protein [Flavobacterium sp. NKUCC04_CG]|uniref:hypothetical protein n=1 Tax=Flavobacterium sp. NKUCC04_CG TaxID=2842121 RepID=UPI001C5B1BBD|nr:hypothetical protein [Flavobacterium sp. NKUCC04_CG]MBW3520350.1 hypothetical protein [Flavobacterium sp. NKUCC04_CG]